MAQPAVKVQAERSQILIGDQFKYQIELIRKSNEKVFWASIPDSLDKFTIVSRSKIDTLQQSDPNTLVERQTLILTCFDSGAFYIPPVPFLQQIGQSRYDTLLSESLLIKVESPQVDTTKAIKDIKKPITIPFSWWDLLPYLIALLAIAGLGYLAYYFYQKNKRKVIVYEEIIPARPYYEIALEQLDELKQQKLWQNAKEKQYHTKLTDIIRNYIEQRFRVMAMEQTSEEIIGNLRSVSLPPELKEKLQQVLLLADYVKFAKAKPNAAEHELSWRNAYDFIMESKIVESIASTSEIEAKSNTDKNI